MYRQNVLRKLRKGKQFSFTMHLLTTHIHGVFFFLISSTIYPPLVVVGPLCTLVTKIYLYMEFSYKIFV